MDGAEPLGAVAPTEALPRLPRPVVPPTSGLTTARPLSLAAAPVRAGEVEVVRPTRKPKVQVVVVDAAVAERQAVWLVVGRLEPLVPVAARSLRRPAAVPAQTVAVLAPSSLLHVEKLDTSGGLAATRPASEGETLVPCGP